MQDERRFIRLSEVSESQIRYLWPNRIPLGAITFLDGDPGCGKSTLIADITARLTNGWAMPHCDGAVDAAGVVLLQAEDILENTIVPNLRAAGANLEKILAFDKRQFRERPLLIPGDVHLIGQAIAQIRAKLVVIDPLTAYLEGSANNARSVYKSLGPIAEIAERMGIAVVIVRHLRKASSSNPLHLGAGSLGVVGMARSSLLVGPDPSSDDIHQHVIALAKSNVAAAASLIYRTIKNADGTIQVVWLGETQRSAEDLAAAMAHREDDSSKHEAAYVLYSILADGPVPANEVLRLGKQAGVAERTLKRAKKMLKIPSKKKGSGTGTQWFWQLPEDQQLLQAFKERDIADLMEKLIHGDPDDPPLPGDEWKEGNWDPHRGEDEEDKGDAGCSH